MALTSVRPIPSPPRFPHQRLVDLRERIEDVRQKIRGDPDPRVANRQDELAPSVPTESLDPSALRRELDCIGQEIADDLFQPSRVGFQLR